MLRDKYHMSKRTRHSLLHSHAVEGRGWQWRNLNLSSDPSGGMHVSEKLAHCLLVIIILWNLLFTYTTPLQPQHKPQYCEFSFKIIINLNAVCWHLDFYLDALSPFLKYSRYLNRANTSKESSICILVTVNIFKISDNADNMFKASFWGQSYSGPWSLITRVD